MSTVVLPQPRVLALPVTRTRTLAIAGAVALVKLATALPVITRYGWDRDELYFLAAAHHLGPGYVDFPALTAVVGRLTIDVFGPSLTALRLTGVGAAMMAAGLVVLCAREFGGGARAQALAGLGFVLSPYGLGLGMLFHPTMFDALAWVAFAYVALRILRRPEPRLWALLGLIAGIGLETKSTIAALLVVFALALVILGPRRCLAQRGPWLAAAIALACLAPYLGWQVAHGWPSLAFMPTQAAKTAAATPPVAYVAQQLAFLGGALALVAAGTRGLWRDPRTRALAVLAPALIVAFFLEHGRSYYALPAIALPLAAGAVAVEQAWLRHPRLRRAAVPLVVVHLATLVLAAPLVWPMLPARTMIADGVYRHTFYADELGWPALAEQTARALRAIPLSQRAGIALLAQNYGEAGALEMYGPRLGLPAALSGHLSFQYWHPAVMSQRRIVTVGFARDELTRLCRASAPLMTITMPSGVVNDESGRLIALCTLRAPLGQLWRHTIASDAL